MNILDDDELGTAIRTALHKHAASVQPVIPESPSTPRPNHRALVAAISAAFIVVSALGIGIWLNRDRSTTSRVSSGRIIDGRVEVMLDKVSITSEFRRS